MNEVDKLREDNLREVLKTIGINYDEYKDDGLALLNAIAAKWDDLGQLDEDSDNESE